MLKLCNTYGRSRHGTVPTLYCRKQIISNCMHISHSMTEHVMALIMVVRFTPDN